MRRKTSKEWDILLLYVKLYNDKRPDTFGRFFNKIRNNTRPYALHTDYIGVTIMFITKQVHNGNKRSSEIT